MVNCEWRVGACMSHGMMVLSKSARPEVVRIVHVSIKAHKVVTLLQQRMGWEVGWDH